MGGHCAAHILARYDRITRSHAANPERWREIYEAEDQKRREDWRKTKEAWAKKPFPQYCAKLHKEWAMKKAQKVQKAQDVQKARDKMQIEKERVDSGGTRADTWTGHLRHAYSSVHVRTSSRRVGSSACTAAVAPSAAPPSEAIGGEGGRGGVLAECQHVFIACICPITAEIMTDPVSTMDGFTYERAAITEWLRTNDTSPFTGAKLESKMLCSSPT